MFFVELKPARNNGERAEVQEVASSLNAKKSSGYFLIIGKILKELPTYWNKVSYPTIQCSLAQNILLGTMESHTDHPDLKARETS
jgi:hypothetical protein